MKHLLAWFGLCLAAIVCATGGGCGSSSRDGFVDPTAGAGGPGGTGLASDGGLGGGAAGTLDCKGLQDGTKSSAGCDY